MKVILVGGAGFIGSHIAEGYVDKGYEVIVVDNLSTGRLENIQTLIDGEKITFHQCSMLDYEELEKIFEMHKPDIINNHAAQKSVPFSVENPIEDNNLNIIGILNLIKLAEKYNVKKFLNASSGGVLSKEIIIDGDKSKEEDMPLLFSPYAITKYASEKYLELYSELYGFDYIGLRYANVFGPRQVAEGDCGVIPIFVKNISENKESILMTYDDMPDGCTRDYIYVTDVADINIKATGLTTKTNGVYNLGLGKEFTIGGIYKKLIDAFGVDYPLIKQGPRKGDVKRSVLDCSKACTELGFKATVSMDEGIEKLVASYRESN